MDPVPPSSSCITNVLPPELLGEIFVYSSLFDPEAPLLLGAVCRTFHRVARATPQAWTRLSLRVVTLPLAGMDGVEHQDARWIRKAGLWFGMAGACLVDLHVEMSRHLPPTTSHDHFSGHRSHRAISPPPQEHPDNFFHSQKELEEANEWGVLLLPHVLHEYRYRIRGLSLLSTTVDEAQGFFSALYPPPLSSSGTAIAADHPSLPLESLTFHASDGSHRSGPTNPHSRSRPLKISPVSISVSLSHCHFPHLAHLKFVNHPLPLPSSSSSVADGAAHTSHLNGSNLRSLSITYPIRFAPIQVGGLLDVLKSAPLLERLEIEGRVIDSTSSQSPTSPSSSSPISSSSSSSSTQELITLPSLTYLSLRINNLPAVLSHLLLPVLHTLRLDDLDGKRANAAAQTAAMLRQLLVRMELPCEGVKRHPDAVRGLQVLDMCSVALSGGALASSGMTYHHSTADDEHRDKHDAEQDHGKHLTDADAIWDWCFRRMRVLRELRAAKMDADALLLHITPRMPATPDDVVLPHLERLVIFDTSTNASNLALALPSSPSSSSLSLHPHVFGAPSLFSPSPRPASPSPAVDSRCTTSGPVLKFQMRRPEVHVEYHRMQQDGQLPPNVDYLELYGAH